MSLEKWVEYGWLRPEPMSLDEVKSLLGIVDRGLDHFSSRTNAGYRVPWLRLSSRSEICWRRVAI